MSSLDEEANYVHKCWYLVHCQPGKELYAARSLDRRLKLQIFLPERELHLRDQTRKIPFFPGYIFIFTNLQCISLSSINTCPGVLRLVDFGEGPQPVPHSVVEFIAQQLAQLNGNTLSNHHFHLGDIVQMKGSALQDLKLVFAGSAAPSQRVYVLLEFLGRLKKVQIDVERLEKVPGHIPLPLEFSTQRIRYTRGKGRKIYSFSRENL
jgi:transcriptional antiterminator RfaH